MNGHPATGEDGAAPHEPRGDSPAVGALPTAFALLGFGLLLLWSCTRMYTDKPADYAGQVLILLTAIALFFLQHPLRRSFVFALFWLALATQLASWGLAHWLAPEIAERSPKVERLAAWFFMIPVAVFIRSDLRRVFALWSLALVALMLAPWISGGGWGEIAAGLGGERVGFGIINQQHTSLLFGLALLGLLAFAPRAAHAARVVGRPWLTAVYAALVLAALVAVVISQTRAIWLALLVTLFAWLCRALFLWRRRGDVARASQPPRSRAVPVLAALVVLVPVLLGGVIVERVSSEGPLAGAGGDSPMVLNENIRVRLATWGEALHWIAKRPLFGWGGGGRSEVVQATDGLSRGEKKRFRHLHSSYLDTLVNFGLAGLMVGGALLWWLNRAIMQAGKAGRLDADLRGFWYLFVSYWLVVNLFESYMFYESGLYSFALVAGGYLALVGAPGAVHSKEE
ncbi:O-antigen ligase family protein [Mangrovimicrobium sediminis]|uniref:O-antigen ligase family protein n=1 Tax=Mangrovimicrobium sediminis TaxID=2562682 RepID=A0A4Z0LV10_9GAMM|nr:O-antigen ligase family protein [Haliea sp. SAOS-164]TGD70905.1 O-antigen ligase family protein [Haliea sp. SAOS-164]